MASTRVSSSARSSSLAKTRSRVADIARYHFQRQQLARTLSAAFGALDVETLRQFVDEGEGLDLGRGEVLFRQGDPGDSFYFVVSGRLQALVGEADGSERVIGEIARGETIGEMAIWTAEQRSATVRAARDSSLMGYSQQAFDRLTESRPQILRRLGEQVIARLRRTIGTSGAAQTATNIVVLPASGDEPMAEFSRTLTAALAQFGTVRHLDSAAAATEIGTSDDTVADADSPQRARLSARLDDLEAQHDHLLLEADGSLTAWTQECLRRTDHIIVVAQAANDPKPGELEEFIEAQDEMRMAAKTLVLLHDKDAERPSGTASWLQPRRVDRHHHVRWDTPADFARLARFITGRAVGLVLSGGGARGFAHVGVVRALHDVGVPVDIVGGVSMGAIMGAQYVLGWSPETMLSKTIAFTKSLADFTLPIVSLIKGRKVDERMEGMFGGVDFEDLWTPFFAVSANLTRAQTVLHDKGPILTGVRASNAPPGMIPPVVHEGDLLVDGFILNNIPVDIMRQVIGGGVVIAVDVSPPVDLAENSPYGGSLSGWRVLWSRLNPFAKTIHLPNIGSILMRSHELYSISHRKEVRELADLYLIPPIDEFDMFNYGIGAQVAEASYQRVYPEIEAWWQARSPTKAAAD